MFDPNIALLKKDLKLLQCYRRPGSIVFIIFQEILEDVNESISSSGPAEKESPKTSSPPTKSSTKKAKNRSVRAFFQDTA